MAGLAEIIHELKTEKGLSDELVRLVIEDALMAVYKKRFSTDENAVVDFSDDNSEVALYSKRNIVDVLEDPVLEITLDDAKELDSEYEVGDQILIEIKPEEFTRSEIQVATQRLRQKVREFESDSLQSEFKTKQGEIVIGYFLRESNKNIIVDLGKTEGLLPKRFQSPKDNYRQGDKIKALVHSVERKGNQLEIVLSRTHTDFVKKVFELEVPELYDGTIEIEKIVREPGYRTKLAVRSNQSDVDPIGTCVGARGARINNVMLELDNERIDILRYDSDPLTFIHNSLSPAEVSQVIIQDYAKRNALAVVEDEKFSIAIGKLGLNVRLANRLTDWNITVKSETDFREMDQSSEAAKAFFNDDNNIETPKEEYTEEVDISRVRELPGIQKQIAEKLELKQIEYIEDLLKISNAQLQERGFTDDEISHIRTVLSATIEIEEDEDEVSQEQGVESASEAKPDQKEDADQPEEYYDEAENLSINALPLKEDILHKLVNAGIEKLYDLVVPYSENRLDEIADFTDEEKERIEKIIKDNVQFEDD